MCILEITSDILTVSMKMNVNECQLIDVIESLKCLELMLPRIMKLVDGN